jgi:hypothetical protein
MSLADPKVANTELGVGSMKVSVSSPRCEVLGRHLAPTYISLKAAGTMASKVEAYLILKVFV